MTSNPRTIEPDRPFGHALHLMYEASSAMCRSSRTAAARHGSARDASGPTAQFIADLETRVHIGEILG